ncbi:excisionase family DNA binding protein [Neobacillus niacini]|uniref:excisionase family DNA-binding protein n=1 Tax=Neobacillus niacini TaxID=86668 RepID=UPI00285C25AD|nr:excisionase family DNA-binding protein [Neobacillus niacini]MDR7080186.1 excisionase family DNA binding protein [Neobacillus niacini]
MERTKKYTTWESLPDNLTALQIASYLGISRRRVYELFQVKVENGGIPVFQLGASKRVKKDAFRKWHNELKIVNK